jgi:hypothetical protein
VPKLKAIRVCAALALAVSATGCIAGSIEGYCALKRIQIIEKFGGENPTLAEAESTYWDEGQAHGIVSGFLIYILVATRKNLASPDGDKKRD